MTDLSEESMFEAGRYAFAVWSRLVAMKKLSSSQLEGQEQLGGAEAAGLRPVCVVVGEEKAGHGLPRP